MRYALLVAAREYGENARTKGFWLSILFFPILLYAAIEVPALLEKRATPTRYFALLDATGDFGAVVDAEVEARYEKQKAAATKQAFDAALAGTRDAKEPIVEPRRKFLKVPLPVATEGKSREELIEALRPYLTGASTIQVDGKPANLFAFISIPAEFGRKAKGKQYEGVEFWCSNLADRDLSELVEDSLLAELKRREFLASGVASDRVAAIQSLEVDVAGKDPKKAAGQETVGMKDMVRQWAPVAFVYLLFVAIMTVAQMLLNNTTEEKSNRIVEVLLSSVTPWELMAGKLLGVAAVGLTMLTAWLGSGLGILYVKARNAGADAIVGQLLDVFLSGNLLLAFGVYFVLGYVMYASLFIAIGAMCNTIKDAQNLMGPVMLVMIVPLLTMAFIPKDPNGTLAVVLSWIPIYTPFVMMNRAAADPPLFDVIGTGVLLVVSVGVTIWLAGRIFRVGILRTGQPPKLLELVRWIRG